MTVTPSPPRAARSVSILVIEDNPPLRRLLSVTLRTAGYRVLEAADGRSALALVRTDAPALVLQDMMLPDIEATALLDELRAATREGELPVVAISGAQDKLAVLEARGAAFSAFLLKPIDSAALLRVAADLAPLPVGVDAAPQTGRVLLADDDPVQRKLAQLQLQRLGLVVAVAQDGATALAAARLAPPDLVVSDVLMPGLDGFELCHTIRTDPALRGIPVILTSSAYITTADRGLALRAGATALVERSPDLAELIEAVQRCRGQAATASSPGLDFTHEHARRVRAQLDLQARENRQLRERARVSLADLAVLAGVSGAVARANGRASMLAETLPRCLEAGGMTAAGVWLYDEPGQLTEAAHAGRLIGVAHLREQVRAATAAGAPRADLFEPRGAVGVTRVLCAPRVICARLGPASAPLGVLAFGWDHGGDAETRRAFTRAIAGQLSEGLALERSFEALEASRAETIARLALAVESRDGVTARHTDRVSELAATLSGLAGLDAERVGVIRVASLLHDVGKIGVSDTILLKPGRLTAAEFAQMQQHTTIGHRILAGSEVELLQVAASIALTHHERIDGCGYPNGLAGETIPIEGRIVAVADVFDALTSDRVYRPAMALDEALAIMVAQRGTQFDPDLLDLFLRAVDRLDTRQVA